MFDAKYKTKYIEKLTLHHEKDQLCSKQLSWA